MKPNTPAVIVSFSGIDGAGKTSQIDRFCSWLSDFHIEFERWAFWDNVVLLPNMRAQVTFKVLGGEEGIGAPGAPVRRADKNVRRWYLTLARCALYFSDAIRLRYTIARARRRNFSVIVFDRYIYDQLANAPFNWLGRMYISAILKIVPKPDLAFLLDADPEAAFARKPEYPLDFLRTYRESYLRLTTLAPELAVIPVGDADSVEQRVVNEVKARALLSNAITGEKLSKIVTERRHVRCE